MLERVVISLQSKLVLYQYPLRDRCLWNHNMMRYGFARLCWQLATVTILPDRSMLVTESLFHM